MPVCCLLYGKSRPSVSFERTSSYLCSRKSLLKISISISRLRSYMINYYTCIRYTIAEANKFREVFYNISRRNVSNVADFNEIRCVVLEINKNGISFAYFLNFGYVYNLTHHFLLYYLKCSKKYNHITKFLNRIF